MSAARIIGIARATVLPWWVKWIALAALCAACFGAGVVHEARNGADRLVEYVSKQAANTVTMVKREVQVVTKTEIRYRDRIQKIYDQGEQLASHNPEIVAPAVDRRLPLPAGFVRILDAAWTGAALGPAADYDGEPAAVPPSENEADNAISCHVWREQALGWREFYAGQQIAINGKAGAWATIYLSGQNQTSLLVQ